MKIFFSINSPKIEKRKNNRGEDAPPVNKDGIMIICDGTGATGQSEHIIDSEVYTSAYLGSRETSKIAEEFLSENYVRLMDSFSDIDSVKKIVAELGKTIQSGLIEYVEKNELTLTVYGKSFKLLPTTFTAVVYKIYKTKIEAVVLCAGDSGAFWWDARGLHRLSVDDNDNNTLSVGDCSVSNCVSADSDFKISFACYNLDPKGIILTTSDGFTDPIKSFEQERYLIEWIGNSDNFSEENSYKLSEEIAQKLDEIGFTQRDDCSISGVIAGYDSSEELKDDFRKRYKGELIESYLKPNKELSLKCRVAEEELSKAKNVLLQNEQHIVTVIKDKILNYAETLNFEDDVVKEPLFKILTDSDAVSSEIGKEKNRIDIALKDDLAELSRKESELKAVYLEFSKLLCKEFGNVRFSRELMDAVNEYYETESRLKEYSENINKYLSFQKQMPETDAEILTSVFLDKLEESVKNLSENIELAKSVYGSYQKSKETVDEYFNFQNPEIERFFEEDINDHFLVIKKISKIPIFLSKKQSELKKIADRIIKLHGITENIKSHTTEKYIHKIKSEACRKKLMLFSTEIAKELLYKDDCWTYIFDETDLENLPLLESYKNAKINFKSLINQRENLVITYNEEYGKYLLSPNGGSVFVRKAD